MPFIPITPDDEKEMLKSIGIDNFDDLLKHIPESHRMKEKYNLRNGLSELKVVKEISGAIQKNEVICFAGGGVYDHFIPSAVIDVISKPEFKTAYTPYQPEVSQGTLQTIFEYQSVICDLTKMEVSNASLYDGASALAEALMIGPAVNNRNTVLIAQTVNPRYREVVSTYFSGTSQKIVTVPYDINKGNLNLNTLKDFINNDTSIIAIQHPNYFGIYENIEEIVEIAHKNNSLIVQIFDPISLALLKPPGDYDIDIAVAEGQCLGNPLNFGGPLLGIFTCKKSLIRKIPGRLTALTEDVDSKRGFVLTLQTREQHIRREKATSNICTSQQLVALASLVYLSSLGPYGLIDVAKTCYKLTHYLYESLLKIGLKPLFDSNFFREFSIKLPEDSKEVLLKMTEYGYLAGVDLKKDYPEAGDSILISATEKRTKNEIDGFITTFKKILF